MYLEVNKIQMGVKNSLPVQYIA